MRNADATRLYYALQILSGVPTWVVMSVYLVQERHLSPLQLVLMGTAMEEALANAGMSSDDMDLFIPHQANLRIIESASKRLGVPSEKVFVNIERYGNTSAAAVPIALCEAIEQGRVQQGQHIGMVAFGAGLTWAAAVVKWTAPVVSSPVPAEKEPASASVQR